MDKFSQRNSAILSQTRHLVVVRNRSVASSNLCRALNISNIKKDVTFQNHHPSFSNVATTYDNSDKHYTSGNISNSNNNVIPFLLADIGEGIAEVELLQWYVSPGDTVNQFDKICEVQSDKATVEITSRYDGVVHTLSGKTGDMLKVGEPLMFIIPSQHLLRDDHNDNGNQTSDASPNYKGTNTLHNIDDKEDMLKIPAVEPVFPHVLSDHEVVPGSLSSFKTAKVLASPAVRKLSKDHKIDLSYIKGSGPKGIILKSDIQAVLGHKLVASSQITSTSEATTDSNKEESELFHHGTTSMNENQTIPIRGIQRIMMNTMVSSLQVPHMTYADEVNMNNLKKLRLEMKSIVEAEGIKLSYLPFFIKAASLSMLDFPTINSSINVEENTITIHSNHDIGIAVDSKDGLLVPVIRNCQEKSIIGIAMELNRLQRLASNGELSESDLSRPTFTLSNIGSIGGTYMSPVVLPPQVAIGAMGRIQRLPRFTDEKTNIVEETNIMNISWGGDHRVLDGATMARFSNTWKKYVQSPALMTLVLK